jgi:molecular chaperone GrpE
MKKKGEHESTPDDPEADTGAAHEQGSASNPAASQSELAAVRAERDLLKDQLTRTMADLQNIRRRHAAEMADSRRRAIESVSGELLPVLDNFHLALAAHEKHESGEGKSEAHALVEGLRMVRSLLEGVLERHGLAEIEAAGTTFDPARHEAMGIDPTSGQPAGTVTEVLQRGYQLGDKIVRPSKVLVAGEPTSQSGGARDEGSGG